MSTFISQIPVTLIALAILTRWLVGQFPYSGANQPPMYGDYEAQRHWMEITTNLHPKEWYQNSTDNDLLYWGLDYPPLTAYHMYLLGKVSESINSSWTELHQSRGTESQQHKLFMRSTVLIADILLYTAPIIYYFHKTSPIQPDVGPSNSPKQNVAIFTALTLFYPAQILIDHGHFQYNCVFLGLVFMAVICMTKGRQIMAAVLFTLSLTYKQMSLYYALPFFWYIAAVSFRRTSILSIIARFVLFGLTVVVTIGLVFSPYILDFKSFNQVINRIFPISRGIFEDKVANIWFCLNIPLKLKTGYPIEDLLKISSLTTLLVTLPAGLHLLIRPSIRSFKYALVNSSLAFFLLSFQVHEKTILVPALPILMLYREHPIAVNWFAIISTFSLQPLLMKDDLLLPYEILLVIYTILSLEIFGQFLNLNRNKIISFHNLTTLAYYTSILGSFALNIGSIYIKPPERYPDIHPTVNAIYSCGHFVMFLLFFYYQQFRGKSKANVNANKLNPAKKTN